MITWSEREWLGLLFDTTFRKFGITLNEFRIFSQSGVQMAERVAFYFYRNSNPVGSFTRAACRSDQGLASFDIDVGTNYDAVIIEPLASTGVSSGSTVTGDSGFLVSELRTCGATEAFCRTFLSTPENSCVVSPDLRITKASGTLTAGSNGSYTINIDNVLGAASTNGAITVVDTLPAGLTYVSASGSGWSCSASGQVVTCTSTTSILPGNTGASLTINVAVGASAVPAVTNVATVSGGGEDGSLAANNMVIVSSTVNP